MFMSSKSGMNRKASTFADVVINAIRAKKTELIKNTFGTQVAIDDEEI
jgi:hypothetical protein